MKILNYMNEFKCPTRPEMIKSLEKDGYLIIPNVLTKSECSSNIDKIWDYLNKLNPNLKREDSKTWYDENQWPYSYGEGLMHYHGIAWNQASRSVRSHDNVLKVFSTLWETDKLHTSVDGINMKRPPLEYPTDDFDFVHVDQDGTERGLVCVQGSVNLIDQMDDDGCFVCWPGSHKLHKKILEDDRDRGHWYEFEKQDYDLMEKEGMSSKRIPVPAGHMILWRSDLAHAGAPARSTRKDHDKWRAVIFVCMLPASETPQTKTMLQKKQSTVLERRTTSHWPSNCSWFDRDPPVIYSKNSPLRYNIYRDDVLLTSVEKRLYGVEEYN
jgi:ectoine hydroxylase-related dioxygenase (phytanoyl-CoA dioxygenase family)